MQKGQIKNDLSIKFFLFTFFEIIFQNVLFRINNVCLLYKFVNNISFYYKFNIKLNTIFYMSCYYFYIIYYKLYRLVFNKIF